jgi:RimJ/RimL family protein N-acetyltransferase
MDKQITLNTDRLQLRPFQLSDAAEVQRLVNVREVADMTDSIPYPYEDGMAEAWISTHEKTWEQKTSIAYAVCTQPDGKLVGCIGLNIVEKNYRASLGYWMGVDYWGNGYCTEACKAVLEFAFATLHLNRIEAFHVVHNPASGAVMKKIGMSLEGTHRQYVFRNGVFSDTKRYAIIASDRQ